MTLYSTIDDDSNNSNELQALGNSLILSAARYHGATDKMISIDWKADRIIVTVDVSADEEYEGGSVVGELEEYDAEDFEDEYISILAMIMMVMLTIVKTTKKKVVHY